MLLLRLIACAAAANITGPSYGLPVFRVPADTPGEATPTVYILDSFGREDAYASRLANSSLFRALPNPDVVGLAGGSSLLELLNITTLPACGETFTADCIYRTGLNASDGIDVAALEALIASARATANVVYSAEEPDPTLHARYINEWASSTPFTVSVALLLIFAFAAFALWPSLGVREAEELPEAEDKED